MKISEIYDDDGGVGVLDPKTRAKKKTEKPPLYKVILHNADDAEGFTVRDAIMHVFHLDQRTATQIMMAAHQQGKSVVGTYPKDSAETKAAAAEKIIADAGYAVVFTTEPE